MNLLDHPLITERYFFPRPDPVPDAVLVETNGCTLRCHRSTVPGARSTVLFFHGNGEVVADYTPWFAEQFAKLGVSTFLAEYRGYGDSSGRPVLGSMLDDVDAIVHAAAASSREIIVFGRSIGSLFAGEVVRRFPDVRGAMFESGIADVLERILIRVEPGEMATTGAQLREAVDEHLNQSAKLAAYGGPVLVLHARHDSMVDSTHGERLAAAAGNREAARLVMFARGDHNNVMTANGREYWDEVAAFVARCEGR
jgi:alpha-beta hydrolase superfamily lysophospholipase